MNPFGRLHPLAILLYYVVAAVLMVGISNPLVNLAVWIMSLLHYFFLTGLRKGFRMLWYSLGTAVLCLMINPLLDHRGVTLLFMLGEWRITKEAVLYGMHMAMLLLASLLLFSCFSHHMTAEKVMTLMGKRMPSFALLFSMILRFVPKAGKDFREMAALHGNHPSMWQALLGITLEDAVTGKWTGQRSCSVFVVWPLWQGFLSVSICIRTVSGFFPAFIWTGCRFGCGLCFLSFMACH